MIKPLIALNLREGTVVACVKKHGLQVSEVSNLQGTGASIFLKSIIFLFLSWLWTGISLEIAVLHTPQQSFLKPTKTSHMLIT